jgi:acyl-CoA synthetase (AMP-forming)/AMP-acid ligase II
MLTHGATVRAYDAWSTVVGLRAGDRYLVVNPFFHSFGLNAGIVASLVKGAAIVPHAVFDVDAVMTRAAEENISMLPGPPTVYQSILDHPRLAEFDMSSLRLAVTGAAAVPVELVRRMRAELGFETIATTSGRAIPDVEVLVVDDKNVEVPRGEAGEVVIRGYNVMRGFIHDPEATAEAIDADGWLHTGDVAVMDDRGYIRITDRTKDMFIVGGFNAYPAEIENMINEHPAVGQVAVVGVPDERMGEVGYAYVIPRLNATITADELQTWCRAKMANYKVPRHFEIVDAVPLNASGKVLKYELRERARATLG